MIYLIFALSAVLTASISWLTTDWYWILIIPFLSGLIIKKFSHSVLSGVVTGIVSWGLPAFYYYMTSAEIIGNRVAEIFQLGNGMMMVFATMLAGVIFAIVASVTGYYSGEFFRNEINQLRNKGVTE